MKNFNLKVMLHCMILISFLYVYHHLIHLVYKINLYQIQNIFQYLSMVQIQFLKIIPNSQQKNLDLLLVQQPILKLIYKHDFLILYYLNINCIIMQLMMEIHFLHNIILDHHLIYLYLNHQHINILILLIMLENIVLKIHQQNYQMKLVYFMLD